MIPQRVAGPLLAMAGALLAACGEPAGNATPGAPPRDPQGGAASSLGGSSPGGATNPTAGASIAAGVGGGGAPGSGGLGPELQGSRPLVVLGDQDFADYYAEILRTEGISSFDQLALSALGELSHYQVAILAPTALDDSQAAALSAWVGQGGRLIALRPDDKLASLLGIGPSAGSISEGYFQVSRARWGISDLALQFHGEADLRATLPGTAAEGQLIEGDKSPTEYPLITLREGIGPGAGKAVSFMFDLGKSVVLTRQGNPARAAQAPQLDSVPRASEFFAGFLDTENFLIPQADEQQRLLTRLLHDLNNDRTPLPRLWYLPGGRKLAVVMTGDDHNSQGTVGFFDVLKSAQHSPAGCSASDWSCARATSWVYSNVSGLKNGAAAALGSEGFELGPHVALDPDGGCADWTSFDDLLTRFSARLSEFQSDYGIPPASTNRSHCFVFSDWDTQPKVEEQLGIRLDENYTPYALPGTKNRLGRLNGSALPMRFTDVAGSTLDIYQLVSDMDYEYFDSGTSRAQMAQAIGALFDSSTGPDGFWGFVGTHYDYSGGLESEFRAALLGEILTRQADGVAMISAKQLLDWLDLRSETRFDELSFDAQTLRFQLHVPSTLPDPGLEGMLPASASSKSLVALRRDAVAVPLKRTFDVRGLPHVFFDAKPGSYEADYR